MMTLWITKKRRRGFFRMKFVITEEQDYYDGKLEIDYCVRIKLIGWKEHTKSFFSPADFDKFDNRILDSFKTLKEAKRCKKLYELNKFKGVKK